MAQISAPYHLPVRSCECGKIAMGKGRHRYKYKCGWKHFRLHFSITVQRICMKFVVVIEPNSTCFSLFLGDCSFFSFGVRNVLVSRFVSPFKCAVD